MVFCYKKGSVLFYSYLERVVHITSKKSVLSFCFKRNDLMYH